MCACLANPRREESQQRTRASAFRRRLAENFFRRFWWYLLPVVVMTAIGVMQAGNTIELYRSTGTLSASSNPLVPDSPNRAASAQFFETPAGTTSRIINERLQTDTFLIAVADEAELGDAIETGLLELDVVRSSLSASARGDAILSVSATWADPQTSYQLATATIAQYQQFLAQTIASDAAAAVEFYETQLADLLDDRAGALDELRAYVAELPPLDPDERRPIDQEIQIDLLRDQVRAVDDDIASTRKSIDDAQLAVAQQTTNAGQSFIVIDEPTVPTAPDSTLMQRLSLIVSFFLLGVVMSGAALLIATVLDSSISSPADVLAIDGVNLVAVAPIVAIGPHAHRRSGRGRRRRRAIGPARSATT